MTPVGVPFNLMPSLPYIDDYISNVEVQPFWGKCHAILNWELGNRAETGSTVTIQRSDSTDGSWETIGNPSATNLLFIDEAFRKRSIQNGSFYYRLTLVPPAGSNSPSVIYPIIDPRETTSHRNWALWKSMLDRFALHFRLQSVRPYTYIRRLTSGAICSCRDGDTGESMGSSQCEECYGTSIIGGYSSPLSVYVLKPNVHEWKKMLDDSTEAESVRHAFIGLAVPGFRFGDLVVDHDRDERYVVTQPIQTNEVGGRFPVTQYFPGTMLDKKDIRYNVDTTLFTFYA